MKVPRPLDKGCVPGFTFCFRPDRDADGAPVPSAAGWKYLLRGPGGKPSKTIFAADKADAVSEAHKQVARWSAEAGAKEAAPVWTVSATIAAYLASKQDKGTANAGTLRAEEAWIKGVIAPYFVAALKDPAVDAITEAHVRDWKKIYVDDDASDSTKHHRTRVLRALFAYAVRKGQRPTNPAEDFVIRPKFVKDGGDQHGHYPLSAAEMGVLQTWLNAHAPPSVAFAIRLAAGAGLRDQELTHLRLEDVRLEDVTPHVRVANFACNCAYCAKHRGGQRKTKTKREREPKVPPELVAPFKAYLAARAEQVTGPWVFPVWSAIRSGTRKPGNQLGRSVLNDWLQKAVKAAQIAVDEDRFRLVAHSLRAFAYTELSSRSHGNFIAVSVQLGHLLPGMGEQYSTLVNQPAKHYAELFPSDGRGRHGGLAIVA
jgi:integrase